MFPMGCTVDSLGIYDFLLADSAQDCSSGYDGFVIG